MNKTFKVGDQVIALIEKGQAKEGDVGVIDAIKGDRYLVGFYATEDAMMSSGYFYPEELAPYVKEEDNQAFIQGDIVQTLIEYPGLPKGSIGLVVMEVSKGAYAVGFSLVGNAAPSLFPLQEKDLLKIGHQEEEHHHH